MTIWKNLSLLIQIKGRRPFVPRCVKFQYVVNMSTICMLKNAIRGDGKFPPLLIKCSMGLFNKPGALQNTYN